MFLIGSCGENIVRCDKCDEAYYCEDIYVGWICEGCDKVMGEQKQYEIVDVDSYDETFGYDAWMLCWSCNKELRK